MHIFYYIILFITLFFGVIFLYQIISLKRWFKKDKERYNKNKIKKLQMTYFCLILISILYIIYGLSRNFIKS